MHENRFPPRDGQNIISVRKEEGLRARQVLLADDITRCTAIHVDENGPVRQTENSSEGNAPLPFGTSLIDSRA